MKKPLLMLPQMQQQMQTRKQEKQRSQLTKLKKVSQLLKTHLKKTSKHLFSLDTLPAEARQYQKELPWWYLLVANISQLISWLPWFTAIKLMYRLQISGRENLRLAAKYQAQYKSGTLFVAKHTGELDIMLVLTGIPPFHPLFPMFYVAQHVGYYQSKDFGWHRFVYNRVTFNALGSHEMRGEKVTYDSVDAQENYEEALRLHYALLKRNHSVCVFPEGKIPEDGSLREPYGIAGYLAESGAVIVPISIKRIPGRFRTTIKLHYGKPLRYDKEVKRYLEIAKKEAKNPYKKVSEFFLKNHIAQDLELL